MMSSDPHKEVISSKYNIRIDRGPVIIGDNLHVEQYFQGHHAPSGLTLNAERKRDRSRLLAKVRDFWIHGVFEQSLHGQTLIALGLRQHSDVLENPWRFVLQVPHQPAQQLQAGTRIIEVYDEALGELLILGEPGSGKTTLLLELTRNLLDRAESDESHWVPLVFNLSSWAIKQQSLDDWLVEEINKHYQVPRLLAQAWIDTDQVLPLLDGLDEVARDARDGCVQAINTSRLRHGLVPLVVCSRSTEYMALSSYVQLRTAVTVLPLTLSQIDTYLSQAGGKLAAVEIALHEDPILQELAETPLMLNILIVTYVGKSAQDLLVEGSLEARRRAIFFAYIKQMLNRRSPALQYPVQRTMQLLTWLAWQMKQHNQSAFYIEGLQSDWLPGNWSRLVYHVSTGLIFCLIVGLVGGLFFGFLVGLFFGLAVGLIAGLIGGLTTAALLFDEGEAREKDVLKYLTQGQIRLELCRDLL